MNTQHALDQIRDEETTGGLLTAAPAIVEVRRNGGLSALIGAAASAVAIAYLARATATGAAVDWLLVAVMGVIGAVHLRSFVDARTPLLVADSQGVRLRLGRSWRGLPWGALAEVAHTPRPALLRDGRLVFHPHSTERVLAELDAAGRRQSRLSEKLYGAPFALPLGLATRVTGAEEDLTTALRQLAGSSTRVLEHAPAAVEVADRDADVDALDTDGADVDAAPRRRLRLPDPRPAAARAIAAVSGILETRRRDQDEPEVSGEWDGSEDDEVVALEALFADAPEVDREDTVEVDRDADETGDAPGVAVEAGVPGSDGEPEPIPIAASPTPSPLRESRRARRAEVRATVEHEPAEIEGRELRRHGQVSLVEETETWGDRVRPLARPASSVEPLVIDDFTIEPVEDPVIGPELAAARTRCGLTVDQLAERTRIRPHVIESIEVDDFASCGGDFYARGHLRTLARVLGVGAQSLLTTYEDRYADAPINARRVFEAELATGASGGIRSTKGGPNWSMLVAAVMVVVLAWSIARLVMDDPEELVSPAAPSAGVTVPNFVGTADVQLEGVAPGSHVVVHDKEGETVFSGHVAPGSGGQVVDVLLPLTVEVAAGPGSVKVTVEDRQPVEMGADDTADKRTFEAER